MLEFQLAQNTALRNKIEDNARLSSLSGQIAEKNGTILEIERSAQKYAALYEDVVTSKSWQMMERLIRLRLKLIPRASKRERLFGMILRPILVLRHTGIRGMSHQIYIELENRNKPKLAPQPGIQFCLMSSPVMGSLQLDLPSIAIIVIRDHEVNSVDEDAVMEWVHKQTLSQCARIMIWNRPSRTFHWIDSRSNEATAENLPELLRYVHEKYICIASSDLLCQEESYLEENLLALETGQYALTINFRGSPDFSKFHLSAGRLPGNYQKPLFRMIIRKECVRDELYLDLAKWKSNLKSISEAGQTLIQQEPHRAAGLIIDHMRNQDDQEADIPFQTQASEPIQLVDRFLLLEKPEQRHFEPFIQPLAPIRTVMRAQSASSPLPTVFLIQPFLAVGGAEKIALKIMEKLADRIRFVVLTFEQLLPELGTSTEQFRSITPYVYEAADFLPPELNQDFMDYLIHQFDPHAIYIANGTPWIYEIFEQLETPASFNPAHQPGL